MKEIDIEENKRKEIVGTLQQIRRANNGMRACAEILIENGSNSAPIPSGPSVFLRITTNQEAGLHFAIEGCAELVDRLF
jgi:hypothetical protein